MPQRLQEAHSGVKHDKAHTDGHEERAARILHIARQVEKPLRMRIGDGKERIDDIGQRDRHDAAQDHALRRGAVDEHILVAHPHRRQQRHTGHIERHRILIHPPLGALILRKRGNDINDHIDDAEQQHNEEGIPLPVPLAGVLRALLDEHDEEKLPVQNSRSLRATQAFSPVFIPQRSVSPAAAIPSHNPCCFYFILTQSS